jgi:hypothetical protein
VGAFDGVAADWLPVDHTTFVVADAGLVVGEEHFADEFAPAAHTRFSNALFTCSARCGPRHSSPAICVVE